MADVPDHIHIDPAGRPWDKRRGSELLNDAPQPTPAVQPPEPVAGLSAAEICAEMAREAEAKMSDPTERGWASFRTRANALREAERRIRAAIPPASEAVTRELERDPFNVLADNLEYAGFQNVVADGEQVTFYFHDQRYEVRSLRRP